MMLNAQKRTIKQFADSVDKDQPHLRRLIIVVIVRLQNQRIM